MNPVRALRAGTGCLIVILCGIVCSTAAALAPSVQRTFEALAESHPGMVLAYVTVNGPRYQALPRLERENFRIWEDGSEQTIEYFEYQDDPLSVGILWGVSNQLSSQMLTGNVSEINDINRPNNISEARLTPLAFLESLIRFPPPSGGNVRNRIALLADLQSRDARVEYFIMETLSVRVPYTTDVQAAPQVYPASPGSLDAIYTGLDVLKEAAYGRQALLMITDDLGAPAAGGGEDGAEAEEDVGPGFPADATGTAQSDTLKALAIRQGVPVYYISLGPIEPAIQHIADITGGDGFVASGGFMAESAAVEIAQALNNQYLIGYHPANSAPDGKWRSLRVQIVAPEGSPELSGRIKSGYYAPRN